MSENQPSFPVLAPEMPAQTGSPWSMDDGVSASEWRVRLGGLGCAALVLLVLPPFVASGLRLGVGASALQLVGLLLGLAILGYLLSLERPSQRAHGLVVGLAIVGVGIAFFLANQRLLSPECLAWGSARLLDALSLQRLGIARERGVVVGRVRRNRWALARLGFFVLMLLVLEAFLALYGEPLTLLGQVVEQASFGVLIFFGFGMRILIQRGKALDDAHYRAGYSWAALGHLALGAVVVAAPVAILAQSRLDMVLAAEWLLIPAFLACSCFLLADAAWNRTRVIPPLDLARWLAGSLPHSVESAPVPAAGGHHAEGNLREETNAN